MSPETLEEIFPQNQGLGAMISLKGFSLKKLALKGLECGALRSLNFKINF